MKLTLSYQSYTRFLIPSFMAIACATAQATDRFVPTERFTEYAEVVDVQPVYREVRLREPREECWTEQHREIVGYKQTYSHEPWQGQNRRERHASNGALVGGIIGGVIGNQLSRGHSSHSRAGATIAGALIGGTIANEATASDSRHRARRLPSQIQRHPVYETRPVEKCRRVVESRYERRLRHYNVTYLYKGRTFTTQLPRDPGNRLELQVSVAPARR